jgi:hypothetical protein
MEFWLQFLASSGGREFMAGRVGGMPGMLAGHPLYTLRIRLQQQQPPVSPKTVDVPSCPPSTARLLCGILRAEGPAALYRGGRATRRRRLPVQRSREPGSCSWGTTSKLALSSPLSSSAPGSTVAAASASRGRGAAGAHGTGRSCRGRSQLRRAARRRRRRRRWVARRRRGRRTLAAGGSDRARWRTERKNLEATIAAKFCLGGEIV